MRWPAPAKLNLFLHVLGRRADGYHLLQTAFQFVELVDYLEFIPRADGLIRRISGNEALAQDADLTVRAARLLRARSGAAQGVDIALRKHIPVGGGLGGGSSDAATTLVALNALWGTGLGTEQLMHLGLELGADVPVFVFGRAAWAEGVGELLEAIDPPEPWYLIVQPACTVSTAEVFADPQLTRDTPAMTMHDFLAGRTRNDCEPVVRRLYPEVAKALDWLRQFAPSRLTGTGACIYATFSQKHEAEAVSEKLPSPWVGFIVRGRNSSPLTRLPPRAAS